MTQPDPPGTGPETRRICPEHGIPDCSPLLNGCTRLTETATLTVGPLSCCRIGQTTNQACEAAEDLFEIQLSGHPEDATLACRGHLGELIDATAVWTGQPWMMSVVWRAGAPQDSDAIKAAALPILAMNQPVLQPVNIVFDGPPGPVPGRFIETETDDGKGIRAGHWRDLGDGRWALRLFTVVGASQPAALKGDGDAG